MIDRRVDWILRIGLAFAFLYPPLDAIVDPYSWLGYFPAFMRGYVPAHPQRRAALPPSTRC